MIPTVIDESEVDAILKGFGIIPAVTSRLPVKDDGSIKIEINIPDCRRHPKQYNFIRSRCKRKVARAGRRGGKTTAVAIIAVEMFLAGRRVLYAAPTSDQLQKFWNEVLAMLAPAIIKGVYEKNESEHSITLPGMAEGNMQRIRAKTAWNADTLRGDYADVLILDEFQLMDEDAWKVVGAPMLIDNNGDAIFIYTPPSLHSKSMSKARDKRHASKLFIECQKHEEKSREKGETAKWQTFHWTSYDNPYVSEEGLAEVSQDMSELAKRQELNAEDVNELPGALWKRATLAKNRLDCHPDLIRLVIGVDPPGGATECGIVAAGLGICLCLGKPEQHGFVIEDRSTKPGQGPEIWSRVAVDLYKYHKADKIIVEKNYGGDMVTHTLATVDNQVIIEEVQATRGKAVRAEPVATLYEAGKIHHVGTDFEDLEDELCQWAPGQGGSSPNRLDAMVWALSKLMVTTGYSPASDGGTSDAGRRKPEFMPPMGGGAWPTVF